MNIKFQRAGDDVDILFSDINGPVTQYAVPLHALISALPEDLLNEFWRPQLDDALAQVDNLRAGLEETSRDADHIAAQRDEAQAEAARLQSEKERAVDTVEHLRVHSNRVATQRDEVWRQLAEVTRERDEALTQVGRLRDMLEEGSQDVVRAVRQRDVARDLNVTLTQERDEVREKWEQVSRIAVDLASERDDLRRQVAIMDREVAEYDNQRRSIRALRRTIKELTS